LGLKIVKGDGCKEMWQLIFFRNDDEGLGKDDANEDGGRRVNVERGSCAQERRGVREKKGDHAVRVRECAENDMFIIGGLQTTFVLPTCPFGSIWTGDSFIFFWHSTHYCGRARVAYPDGRPFVYCLLGAVLSVFFVLFSMLHAPHRPRAVFASVAYITNLLLS